MPLPKLMLTPAQDGYAVSDADDTVLRAKVSAGPSRMRLDMLGAPSDVNITLHLDGGQYQYWRAFFRTTLVEGSLPFRIDLLLDYPDLVEHEAKIVPGSTRLSGTRGLLYVVQARLEVKAIPMDAAYDSALVMLVTAYGDTAAAALILASLEHLVNVDLPAIA